MEHFLIRSLEENGPLSGHPGNHTSSH